MLVAAVWRYIANTIAVVIVKEINDIIVIGIDISVVGVDIGCFSTAIQEAIDSVGVVLSLQYGSESVRSSSSDS